MWQIEIASSCPNVRTPQKRPEKHFYHEEQRHERRRRARNEHQFFLISRVLVSRGYFSVHFSARRSDERLQSVQRLAGVVDSPCFPDDRDFDLSGIL